MENLTSAILFCVSVFVYILFAGITYGIYAAVWEVDESSSGDDKAFGTIISGVWPLALLVAVAYLIGRIALSVPIKVSKKVAEITRLKVKKPTIPKAKVVSERR
jgi:ABC-type arginine transport system permease subunit